MGKPTDSPGSSGESTGDGFSSSVDFEGHPQAPSHTPLPAGRTMTRISTAEGTSTVVFKLYKRRYFGLAQLILLNMVVSWDWIAFAPVSSTAAKYFNTSESNINWVSTAFLFAYCVTTPPTFFVLHRFGPKVAIMIAAAFLLVGNWVKYGATQANSFGGMMVGQLIIGFSQPFVLSAPTSYSNMWFSPAGRTTATAVTSLANPFGAAIGEIVSPYWAGEPHQIPDMVLYIAIIASVAAVPVFFIPAKPPTPPSPAVVDHMDRKSLRKDLHGLSRSPEFYLLLIPFIFYVGFFNAFSSLLNQILEPYGFSEDDAGIAGAILIFVGLICAAITSPIVDKYKFYLGYIKVSIPFLAIFYLVFVWAPESKSLAFVYVVCAILGAASFGLVPVVLEFLVEVHHPLGPELGSSLCWCGGQLLGAIFIVIMDALKDSETAHPPSNMKRALIFQAVLALVVMPVPLCLGLFGRQSRVTRKRWEAERDLAGSVDQFPEVEEEDQRPPDGSCERTV